MRFLITLRPHCECFGDGKLNDEGFSKKEFKNYLSTRVHISSLCAVQFLNSTI